MKRLILIIITGFLFVTAKAQNDTDIRVIGAAQFGQAVKLDNKILIDVRTREEYDEGHIPNAGNIDFYSDDFKSKMELIDRSQPLYIYCKSGKRSSMASQMLKDMGFKNVVELEGGFLTWKGKVEK